MWCTRGRLLSTTPACWGSQHNLRSLCTAVLQLRVSMPHLESIFYDEPLWDLSAPRAACEDYISTTVNELGLDWHAHTLIMRRMKERIDIATKACVGWCVGRVGAAMERQPPRVAWRPDPGPPCSPGLAFAPAGAGDGQSAAPP